MVAVSLKLHVLTRALLPFINTPPATLNALLSVKFEFKILALIP